MKREYTIPQIHIIATSISAELMAGSDPTADGTVKGTSGTTVADFGYGGDGSDGDESDARGSLWYEHGKTCIT